MRNHNWYVWILLGLILVVLAGCSAHKKEQEEELLKAGVCNSFTVGSVRLDIKGNPNDSFKQTLMCGGQRVASCTATIQAGQNTASCTDGPNPVPNGARSCTTQVGNNNSPAAAVQSSGCG